MGNFQTTFSRWIDHQADTLNQWSERCSIQAGVLYRLRAGTKSPTPEIVGRLLPAIARHDNQVAADRLLIAYLQDHIPAGFENELTIELRNAEIVTPDLLEAALAYHAQRAAQDTAYAEHLISLYLLSRESDLTQIDELVARWHAEHTPPSAQPTSKPQPVLSSTTQEQDSARVAEDETHYGKSE